MGLTTRTRRAGGLLIAVALLGTLSPPLSASAGTDRDTTNATTERSAVKVPPESVKATIRLNGKKKLSVRAAPGTSFTSFKKLGNNQSVTVLCQTDGPTVKGGTFGTSKIWDMLSNGGFVSDAYVKTGSDGYVTDKCDTSPRPKKANPRSINAAINWQFAQLGSTRGEAWCLRFQAQSYGYLSAGIKSAELAGDKADLHPGVPPRGALVWYHNGGELGHIVVSLGEGMVIGTSVTDRVGVGPYKYNDRYDYRGWSVPDFPKASGRSGDEFQPA